MFDSLCDAHAFRVVWSAGIGNVLLLDVQQRIERDSLSVEIEANVARARIEISERLAVPFIKGMAFHKTEEHFLRCILSIFPGRKPSCAIAEHFFVMVFREPRSKKGCFCLVVRVSINAAAESLLRALL